MEAPTTHPTDTTSNTVKAAVFAGLVVIWGTTWIAIKIGLEHFPPLVRRQRHDLVTFNVTFAVLQSDVWGAFDKSHVVAGEV